MASSMIDRGYAPGFEPTPPESRTTAKINEGTEDEMTITGYRLVRWRLLLVWAAMAATLGLFWLFLYWVPRWKLFLTHRRIDLAKADSVLIEARIRALFPPS